MKTQRRTIYIADDGSEHQTKEAAELCDTRYRMHTLFNQWVGTADGKIDPADAVNILLENGTYKFNK